MIQAKPTIYNGVQMRSRLEAKWAAFFDQIGWRWEYEPDGFGDYYIPDFMILGPRPLLIEVRPVATEPGYEAQIPTMRISPDLWKHDLLVVGATALPVFRAEDNGWGYSQPCGLIGEFFGPHQYLPEDIHDDCSEGSWGWTRAYWTSCTECHQLGVSSQELSWINSPCSHGGKYAVDFELGERNAGAHWKYASNARQWAPT